MIANTQDADHSTPTPRSSWAVSSHGVSTVMSLEMRQRLRGSHWRITLATCVAALIIVGSTVLLTGMSDWALPAMTGMTALFSVSSGMVVAAHSVVNDRRGTGLGALFGTRLTAAEIMLGKHLTAWCAALAFVILAIPGLILTTSLGVATLNDLWLMLAGLIATSHFAVSTTMLTAVLAPFRMSAIAAAITASVFVIPAASFASAAVMPYGQSPWSPWVHLGSVAALSVAGLILTTHTMRRTTG